MDFTSEILQNTQIAQDIWLMTLTCPNSHEFKAGQFVEIKVPGFYLRRPISVCSIEPGQITIIYKVVGEGTEKLTQCHHTLEVFGPLGEGFPIDPCKHVVLVGGGVGVPPLYQTAKHYLAQGTKVDVVLGFANAASVFYAQEFADLGCHVYVATLDGSMGTKGTVIDAINAQQIPTDFVCSCGPLPMLKAVQSTFSAGYISLESRMACGLGACMGCVIKDPQGNAKRISKEGPVFKLNEVVL